MLPGGIAVRSVEGGGEAAAVHGAQRGSPGSVWAEDPDDRPAQVGAGLVVGAGDQAEQAVDGCIALAPVECREGLEARFGPGQPDSGGYPVGGEIALMTLRRPPTPRPPPRARASCGRAPQLCPLGAAPARRPRATRARRPPARSSSARDGTSPSKNSSNSCRGNCADEVAHHLAVAQGLHCRDALHSEARRQSLARVHVYLGQHDLVSAGGRGSLEGRGVGASGTDRTTPPRSQRRLAAHASVGSPRARRLPR